MITFLLAIPFVGFILSGIFFFKKDDKLSKQQFLITALGPLIMIATLVLSWNKAIDFNSSIDLTGLILFLAGTVLFYLTFYTVRKDAFKFAFSENTCPKLILSGPFKYIRHPFYSSYSLTWLGSCFLFPTLLIIIPTAILLATYFIAASNEEKFITSNSEHSAAYKSYMLTTGMFSPNPFAFLKIFKAVKK